MAKSSSSRLSRGVLLVVSVGLALIAAEVALRLTGFDYSPLIIRTKADLERELPASKSDSRGVHLFQDAQFTYDPRLIWRPRPGESVFNAQGFRGPELDAVKPPGEIRVFAFGDSNTLGWAQRHGANWPEYLGRLLRETDERIVIVNAGVWGYTLLQGAERLREALDYEPDLVLVNFGSNDAHPVYLTDAEYRKVLLGSSIPVLSGLKVAQVCMAFWDRVARPRWAAARDDGERRLVNRLPLADYEGNLRAIVELGAEAGFDAVLMTRPYVGISERKRSWRYWAPSYVESTLAVAAELGVPSMDLRGEFHERRDLFADESHFTRLGHQIAAKRIYDEIAPLLVARGLIDAAQVLPPGERFDERVAIDFGTPAARGYLIEGFSPNREAKGRSAVRSRGERSVVEVALSPVEGAEYLLSFEAMPVVAGRSVEVAISVNGEPAGTASVAGRWRSYELALPGGSLREGINRLELTRREAGSGAAASPPSIVYDTLTLVPRKVNKP